MYTRMINPFHQFNTAQEVDFLIISSLFSFLYLSSSITGEVVNENSGKITDYCYIHSLNHIQILVQSFHYSSRNGFPDYWLIILISISFQFYYWRSRERKIMEKSQIVATDTHCIMYKFQLTPFITAEEMDFLIISSLFSFLYLSSYITGEVTKRKILEKSLSIATYTHYTIY